MNFKINKYKILKIKLDMKIKSLIINKLFY